MENIREIEKRFKNIISIVQCLSPEEACLRTALNTCFDYIDRGQAFPHTSAYMLLNYNKIIKKNWKNIPSKWQNKLENNSLKSYLGKIEFDLCYSILNIILSLNFIIQEFLERI